jgi:hypothetical protein
MTAMPCGDFLPTAHCPRYDVLASWAAAGLVARWGAWQTAFPLHLSKPLTACRLLDDMPAESDRARRLRRFLCAM